MKFELTEEQVKKYQEWKSGIEFDGYAGAIGGSETFSFTPTGLGLIITIKNNITNDEINLTEDENW